jgi:hypothetical protein
MSAAHCTLSVTVAATDLPFLHLTLPHMLRASRLPFAKRMVLADLGVATGQFVRRPGGSVAGLLELLGELRTGGEIDDVVELEAGSSLVREAWHGVFRRPLPDPRDYRGAPIAGYVLSFTLCPTRYLLHFDGDMMIHQPPDAASWIERGIELLEAYPDVGAVLPLHGPPHPEGVLHQRVPFAWDPRGFHRFRSFTSRVFLVDCDRFRSIYPLDTSWPWTTSPGRRLSNLRRRARGESTLPRWEQMVEWAFVKAGLCRADLPGPAWSLHPNARGEEFVRLLPHIIAEVEAGRFPPEQGGRYNLDLDAWRAWCD